MISVCVSPFNSWLWFLFVHITAYFGRHYTLFLSHFITQSASLDVNRRSVKIQCWLLVLSCLHWPPSDPHIPCLLPYESLVLASLSTAKVDFYHDKFFTWFMIFLKLILFRGKLALEKLFRPPLYWSLTPPWEVWGAVAQNTISKYHLKHWCYKRNAHHNGWILQFYIEDSLVDECTHLWHEVQ